MAKSIIPLSALRMIARLRRRPYTPPRGRVRMGDLRRLSPLDVNYGFGRGRPIDRFYIERFLERETELIRGRVLEIGDNSYTIKFGGKNVSSSDVLHVLPGNPLATMVGDLANAPHLPSNAFDCVIITQTLQLIFDVPAAIRTIHRILKPSGVVFATVPGLSQLADPEWGGTWYWSFTELSIRKLFETMFASHSLEVRTHGNVLTAIAFLHGLCDEDITLQELDYDDASYQLLITIKATKSGYETDDRGDE